MTEPFDIPELPLKQFVTDSLEFSNTYLAWFFNAFSVLVESMNSVILIVLNAIHPAVFIVAITAFLVLRRRATAAATVCVGLMLIWNIQYWSSSLDTMSLVILATLPALFLGLPTGVLIAEAKWARTFLLPVLDMMQTLPAFVYLIPSVLFFGVGPVPGVVATAIFALPPFARSVALGLSEVPRQFIEVGHAVGLGRMRILTKIKIPLAKPFLLAGLSQAVMMSLSMVVIASLIGAPGIGAEVVTSLSQMDFAVGIEAGLCIVILAITVERILEATIAGNWLWRR
jgi:ABC-type proline/glycine betaine transport system permease subunit